MSKEEDDFAATVSAAAGGRMQSARLADGVGTIVVDVSLSRALEVQREGVAGLVTGPVMREFCCAASGRGSFRPRNMVSTKPERTRKRMTAPS